MHFLSLVLRSQNTLPWAAPPSQHPHPGRIYTLYIIIYTIIYIYILYIIYIYIIYIIYCMWVCAHYICIYTGSCCALTNTCSPHPTIPNLVVDRQDKQVRSRFSTSCKWQKINGNFRILKWRYCTIQFAEFITMAGFVKKVSMDPRNGGPLRIDSWTKIRYRSTPKSVCQWIGLRENLQESPIFNWKIDGFRLRFSPTNQSIDGGRC